MLQTSVVESSVELFGLIVGVLLLCKDRQWAMFSKDCLSLLDDKNGGEMASVKKKSATKKRPKGMWKCFEEESW